MKLMDCTLRDGGNVVGRGFDADLTKMMIEGLIALRDALQLVKWKGDSVQQGVGGELDKPMIFVKVQSLSCVFS